LWSITPLIDVEAATETLTIEDETGALKEFEVARRGYHREIVTFFWENETGKPELDWLSYGLPIMLEHDINRVSPVVTANVPIDSPLLADRLKEQGYDRLTGVPNGLAIQLSRDRQSDALVVGSFSEDGNSKIVSARVIDAASGEVLETFTGSAGDWMTAIDKVTGAVLGTWEITPAEDRRDDPLSEHFSNSLDAVRHFVLGKVAVQIDGDFPRGVSEVNAALAIDPAFAEARGELSVWQYLSGDLEAARSSATQAMRNSYRLSTTSEFALKANRYIFDGDFERGERVLDMWTEVEPDSTLALQSVAQLSRVRSTSESLDKAMAAYDQLLQLRPNDYTIYRQKAQVEEQRGDYEAAIELLSRYLEFVPNSGPGYQQLARLHQAQGDLDAAQGALEDAAILLADPLSAELGLARLEARRGSSGAAMARLDALRGGELLPQQRLEVLLLTREINVAQGRIREAMALNAEANELAPTVVPPANRIIGIEAEQAYLLSLLGRFDEALELLDSVATQLQPPLSLNLNFNYTRINREAGNRDEFRRWAQASWDARDQLPEFLRTIMLLEQAQIDIWDENFDAAIANVDAASEMLGQSILRTLLDRPEATRLFVVMARLYLDAGAIDKARDPLEAVLRIYPSYAYAKLMLARVLIAAGDADNARLFLEEAIALWSDADEEFVYLQQARETMASLEN
jgi:tetratricopeptide (TPR) repeat protein